MLRRRGMVPVSLTGQRLSGQEAGSFADMVNAVKAKFNQARHRLNEVRPGVIVPVESALMVPSKISIDHERVLPQKLRNSRISVDY